MVRYRLPEEVRKTLKRMKFAGNHEGDDWTILPTGYAKVEDQNAAKVIAPTHGAGA